MENGHTFWLTLIPCVCAAFAFMACNNRSVEFNQNYIARGEIVCKEHGGLLEYDLINEFVCKNGMSIEIPMTQEAKK